MCHYTAITSAPSSTMNTSYPPTHESTTFASWACCMTLLAGNSSTRLTPKPTTLASCHRFKCRRTNPGLACANYKVVKQILNLEFIDMSELLLEAWSMTEEVSKCCHQCHPSHRVSLSRNLAWAECFLYMVYSYPGILLLRQDSTADGLSAHNCPHTSFFLCQGWLAHL